MNKGLLISTLAAAVLVAGCNDTSEKEAPAAAEKPVAQVTEAPAAAEATTTTEEATAAKPAFASEAERLSYSLGLNLGRQLGRDAIDLNISVFSQAIEDGLKGNEPLMSQTEVQQTLMDFQKKQMEDRKAAQAEKEAERKSVADSNKTEGETFLAENSGKDGVVKLDSGLQYKVLQTGDGNKPAETDTVTVHYRGTLINGEEFDSSYSRGQPASFPLNRVIAGWTEALQLMQVGSKWELYIPSDLAYGPGGTSGKIGPNATLIFEVELLSIDKKS